MFSYSQKCGKMTIFVRRGRITNYDSAQTDIRNMTTLKTQIITEFSSDHFYLLTIFSFSVILVAAGLFAERFLILVVSKFLSNHIGHTHVCF